MKDHVERIYLKGVDPKEKFSCRHLIYKSERLVLEYLQHFKNHVQTVYKVSLRE
jgi:hypothetical protein